ncbi:hypothetical protein VNO80_28795 [Phaseolus coccineus]|uniref:Uncharacterized protein n=1 Tax=Phaseolus coccineus TaxID=3886 RepID=A0AAN9LEV4_PHACN
MCGVLWCTWVDDFECVWVNRFLWCLVLMRKRKVVGLKKKDKSKARSKSTSILFDFPYVILIPLYSHNFSTIHYHSLSSFSPPHLHSFLLSLFSHFLHRSLLKSLNYLLSSVATKSLLPAFWLLLRPGFRDW